MKPAQVAALSVSLSYGKTAAQIIRYAAQRALADHRANHQATEPLSIEMLVTSDQRRESDREGIEA